MKVLFNTYPVAFACRGGGEIQLLKSRDAVQELGVEAVLFDQWEPQFKEVDAVHYFSVESGWTKPFCDYVKQIGLPLLISPILWLTGEKLLRPNPQTQHVLKIADVVLPNSQAEADQLVEVFGLERGKIVVVPNGIDPIFSKAGDPRLCRTRFGLEQPFLLSVANIEPRKNQLAMIRALKPLGIDFVLFGGIRDPDYFEACVREGGQQVRYLGRLEHESDLLRSAYSACEAFLLPSSLETPGLAALEAAAQGAKVLVTEIGSTREYFGDLVEYVDPNDLSSFRPAVERLLAANVDGRLREHVLSNFAWRHAGQILASAYETILCRRN